MVVAGKFMPLSPLGPLGERGKVGEEKTLGNDFKPSQLGYFSNSWRG
jgi:hypothetical protein